MENRPCMGFALTLACTASVTALVVKKTEEQRRADCDAKVAKIKAFNENPTAPARGRGRQSRH